jgi:hypothetical protein
MTGGRRRGSGWRGVGPPGGHRHRSSKGRSRRRRTAPRPRACKYDTVPGPSRAARGREASWGGAKGGMPPAPPTPAGRGTLAPRPPPGPGVRQAHSRLVVRLGQSPAQPSDAVGPSGAGMHEHEARASWVGPAALSRPNLVALAIKSHAFSFPPRRNLSIPPALTRCGGERVIAVLTDARNATHRRGRVHPALYSLYYYLYFAAACVV